MSSYKKILVILVIWSTLVIGCQMNDSIVTITEYLTIPMEEEKTLTICLGYEPESLYLYGSSSQSTWAVLEAIYDGPIDISHFQAIPVILTKMPSLENGDSQRKAVNVYAGESVIDTFGNLTILAEGVKVLPSGCNGLDCAITWDGITPLQMDQMAFTYFINNTVQWSDGMPLTANDSVYSFNIEADEVTPGTKKFISQTQSYEAIDEYSVRWIGKPGFLTQRSENYFWLPLPKHAWSKYSSSELLTAENSTRRPLGWGAYILQEWRAGQYIHLIKNPNYFRSNEALPKFNQIFFKFINVHGDSNIEGVKSGVCDFVNQTTLMQDQSADLDTLLNYYRTPQLNVFLGQGPLIEYLLFKTTQIKKTAENTSMVNDLQVRQAIAYCLNRPKINKELFNKLAEIPFTNLSPTSSFYLNELEPYDFNSEKGQQILDEVGWIDDDQDFTTPRVANQVVSITDGTKLSLDMISRMNGWEEKTAILIKESLLECGIVTDLKFFQEDEFFDPQGPFFKSDFDLALFSWMSGEISPCYLFSTPAQEILYSEIPSIDLNVTRYVNPEFDALCKASLQPLVTRDKQEFLQQEIQTILNRDVSFLPLFIYYQADVARNDFCPYELDISARSDLQNIESMDYGVHCQP